MKIRKIALTLAALLGVSCLAACGDNDKSIAFGNYWELDSMASALRANETMVYDVTFEKSSGMNSLGYVFTYENGKYTTTLQYSETEQTYTYHTELSIDVIFAIDETTTEVKHDSIVSTVVFAPAKDELLPISSTKTVISSSPNKKEKVKTIDDCYTAYDYAVVTNYASGSKASSVLTYNVTKDFEEEEKIESTFKYGTGKYSYLDNEQLLLALRAVPSDTTSGSIKTYDSATESTRKVRFSFDSKDTEKFTHTVNGEALAADTVSYRPVTLKYSGTNPGATQTAWIATLTNNRNNANRNMLLKLITPLYHNLGTLTYTLKAATV